MINPILMQKLIERKVVTAGTEIDARYVGYDIAGVPTQPIVGTFVIMGIAAREDGYVFDVASVLDGKRRKIHSTATLMIDGMEAVRLASIYGIGSEGGAVKQGKRRGRKPKALLEQMAREAAGV